MLAPPRYQNNLATGFLHLSEGIKLIWHPKLRVFILVPLAVNLGLFIVLTSVIVYYFVGAQEWVMNFLPTWLAPLAWLSVLVLGMIFLIIYGYSFNLITNIIAAPFYGVLAQKTEELLTGQKPPDEPFMKMIPRVFLREMQKLIYFLSRGFLVLMIMVFIATLPIINLAAPFIGLAWAAWSMTIQYSDYAADNHQKDFKELRYCLWLKKYSSLGFGGFVMLCSIVPLVNIFVMPAAVTGGTSFWLKELAACNKTGCAID